MKIKIILPILYLTLLLIYPKNGLEIVTTTLSENRPVHLQNSTTETNPFIIKMEKAQSQTMIFGQGIKQRLAL